MTTDDKASFCAFASMLLAPPDRALLAMLEQEDLQRWLGWHTGEWDPESVLAGHLFEGTGREPFLSELSAAYEELFHQWNGAAVSLVESTYKRWSDDRECGMVFASSTGLLMGDSAVHMHELYLKGGMELPDTFRSMPDHIVLELEFLSLLYESDAKEKARAFIMEHLDWVGLLRDEIVRAEPHPFYRSAIMIIDAFIRQELKAGKDTSYGPTKIH